MSKSVYIHIPFCKAICSYCDFCKMLYNENFALDYLIALEKEIIEKYDSQLIETIYIGGGTPSSLKITELKKLFNIIKLFKFDKEYEFTFEINLDDIREELLEILKENKVNRLSIGIQSFDKNNLEFLKRDSDFKDAKAKISLCRKYGFGNLSVDLMYAIPGQTMSMLKKDIKKFKKLKTEHISTYSLIIEDHTAIKINNTEYIDESLDAKMYKCITKSLKRNKLNKYEVSNFSKTGYESKHNLVYWNNEEYFGFGLGAAGYYDGVRYENTRGLTDYLSGNFTLEKNFISKKENMDNELMLGFRKTDGININTFKNKFGKELLEVYDLNGFIKEKILIIKGNNIMVNPKSMYLLNEILIKII